MLACGWRSRSPQWSKCRDSEDRVLEKNGRAYGDWNAAAQYLRALVADYVWLPKTFRARTQLEGYRWTPIFQGSRSVIVARTTLGLFRQATGAILPRCFPGP
jgi:hypothetical protein